MIWRPVLSACWRPERYNPARKPVLNFATWRIRGAMLDELRKLPGCPALYQRLRQLQVVKQKMSHTLGREPSRSELAGELGWTLAEVEQVYAQINRCALLSLEDLLFAAPASSTESGEAFPSGAQGPFARPEENLETEERRELLRKAIEELKERERLVLVLLKLGALLLRKLI